ncbi:DUF2267 domain-containing protein [Streptomyces sp. JJ36]|uniref:DUF2267 domain-containing protein n=1 Tax=Streptomyces sp. JJ36 TaxID=2736645 RepID=UPI001F1B6EDA|nr:DUF2267 domain-containing protein [Streptomyces sp. JJ36]MCF6526610.1 DUF2267 domain-containing protein [Streptomyces sp. JJ36]
MIVHERLVEEVAAQARLTDEEALRVLRVTLAALTHRLEMPQRRRLRSAVPGPERDAALATVPPARGGPAELWEEIGRNLGVPPERARHLARIVMSQVDAGEPDLTRELRESLPADFAELFTAPEERTARDNPATQAPAPLSREELDAALRRRPEWSGDAHGLTRTVSLPEDRLPPLLNQVDRDARDLRHTCERERTGGGVTFVLRTRSVDAVTAVDLDLADRIDDAVAAVGSGGRPG